MKVLQLIDSLETGGAERMAVNLANALALRVEGSFLCATRKEGTLKESLSNRVGYLFLNKNKTIDLTAIKKLNQFVRVNEIEVIHAHSTSFFLATILRLLNKSISVVWHDHYGNTEFLKNRKFGVLKFCSGFFSHVFSVNKALEKWAKEKLNAKHVTYLSNYATLYSSPPISKLKGVVGKRIVSLANLRPQKDHFTLIDAFKSIAKSYPEWTLHLVGKDFNDGYSKDVKSRIKELNLQKSVFIYGTRPDVFNILTQCDIGVLSSKSEGLPLALLEYGLAKLPVVVTDVGDCNLVVRDETFGFLVQPSNKNALTEAILKLIENKMLQNQLGMRLHKHILENFSEEKVVDLLVNIYKQA